MKQQDRIIDAPLYKIVVGEERYRTDMGDIESLAESIKLHGLMVPILIDTRFRLIAGERRLRAHKHLELETIRAIVADVDEVNRRIYEITENIHRKQFDWQEQAFATEDLYNLIKARDPKASYKEVQKEANIAPATLSRDLNLAKALKENPEVFDRCKNISEAEKTLSKFMQTKIEEELAARAASSNEAQRAQELVKLGDCTKLIELEEDSSFDAIISDPFYGIDLNHKKKYHEDGVYCVDDDPTSYRNVMGDFISKAAAKMKPDSLILMFCDLDHFHWLRERLAEHDYHVDVYPGVWTRSQPGQTRDPNRYFGRAAEFFVYGTRGSYCLVKRGLSNVLNYPGVSTGDKRHPVQKPLALMAEILQRTCLPGAKILDFMCGSGTTLKAAIKHGMFPTGFEIDPKFHSVALQNVTEAIKFKNAGEADKIGD